MTRLRRLCLTIFILSFAGAFPAGGQEVAVTFLDVGQGDAILIRAPEGNAALIDAGPGRDIVGRIRAAGVTGFDVVIASHPHEDHIGGMADVLRAMPVGLYVDNGTLPHTDTHRALARAVTGSGVRYAVASGQLITLGSVALQILPLPPEIESENDYSVGVLLVFGEFRALFTGDSETAELHHFLEVGVPEVTVLKAAHHGSRNGVTPQWVFETRPALVVISAGYRNAYGHPHEWALRYYGRYARDILRTDLHGTVTVLGRADGSYHAATERGVPATGAGLPERAAAPEPTASPIVLEVTANPPGNDNDRLNDEYVVVRNLAPAPLAIGGWTLCDAARHCFEFPPNASIGGGGAVIVHTGQGTPDGIHFYYGRRQAVWNNDGDTATLRDAARREVARTSY